MLHDDVGAGVGPQTQIFLRMGRPCAVADDARVRVIDRLELPACSFERRIVYPETAGGRWVAMRRMDELWR